RIAALDGTLRAFITVCADAALESARAAEAELMAGRPVGPLHGVPWAPKDLYSTKGVRTTGGSRILADSVPTADATVVARRATEGLGSLAGCLPLACSLDHVGPMTRSGRDCALMLGAIAGYDPADPTSSILPVPDYGAALTGDVKGLRVGLLRAHFTDGAAPKVKAAVEAAARELERAGAVVDEVNLTEVTHVATASAAIVASEALAYHAPWMRSRPQDYQPDVRERLRLGAFVSGAHYVRSQQVRAL